MAADDVHEHASSMDATDVRSPSDGTLTSAGSPFEAVLTIAAFAAWLRVAFRTNSGGRCRRPRRRRATHVISAVRPQSAANVDPLAAAIRPCCSRAAVASADHRSGGCEGG